MLELAHWCFGNSHGLKSPYHGLKSPYFDAKFYWLNGHLYTFQGLLGAQLSSWQFRHPKPGEVRELVGRRFRPFQSRRNGPLVWVSWRMAKLPDNLDEAHAAIRAFKADLDAL